MVKVTARPFDGRLNGPFYLRGPRPYIDPLHNYYGAVGDGVANDTTALQNSLDDARDVTNGSAGRLGATVQWSGGTYKTTAKLRVKAPASSYQRGISVLGAGPYVTNIMSTVPGDVALSVEGQKFSRMGGFSVRNQTGSRGTTTGIELTSDPANPGSGTMNNGNVWDPVLLDGYNVGLHIGAGQYEASEIAFNSWQVQNCNTGVLGNSFNSLDFLFNVLGLASNVIGVDAGGASNFTINNGSASGNGTDFSVHNGGTFTINGYRSENCTVRFVNANSPSVAHLGLTITGAIVTAVQNADGGALTIALGTSATLIDCDIKGKIFVNGWPGPPASTRLALIGTSVNDTVAFRPTSAGHLNGLTATVLNCKQINSDGNVQGDFDQLIGATYNSSDVQVGGLAVKEGGLIGFNGATPSHPTVTGSRGSNAALASLLTALANLGLLTDSSS